MKSVKNEAIVLLGSGDESKRLTGMALEKIDDSMLEFETGIDGLDVRLTAVEEAETSTTPVATAGQIAYRG